MNSIDDYRNQIQPPDFDAIPARLRAGRYHTTWIPEKRGNKIAKPPFITRAWLDTRKLYRMSSTTPRHWSTFDQARKAYERANGLFGGIGVVLTTERRIVQVDIDHCVSQTGEIEPAAREILELLNTYSERSPSGDGIHMFPLSVLPPNTHKEYAYKGLKIEIYATDRYSTLTGRRIEGTSPDVEERQAEFEAMLQRFVSWENENTVCVCLCDDPGDGGQQSARQNRGEGDQPEGNAPAGTLPNRTTRPRRPEGGQGDHRPQRSAQPIAPAISEEHLPLQDQAILAQARAARNGQTFMALWAGGDPHQRNNKSKADFDLILQLLYWTNNNAEQTERLYRASGRYDEKTDRRTTRAGHSYLQMSIYNAIRRRFGVTRQPPMASHASSPTAPEEPPEPEPPTPGPGAGPHRAPRAPARQDRRITHAHHWKREYEPPEQRQEKLQAAARQVAEQVEQHIINQEQTLLVACVAPGVGKSSTVAQLGQPGTGSLDLAWIAERRDMIHQVEALAYYMQIQPCTRFNCDEHHLHNALGERSYNAWAIHKRHKCNCAYARQFLQSGSAVYQLAHVKTRYPANHQGIIIDELDLSKWLPEREISIGRLGAATRVYATDSTADLFLRSIAAAITDASQARQQPHGLALFEALDKRTGGQLMNMIGELAQDARYTDPHPWYEISEEDETAQIYEVSTLAPVVLPHILLALINEHVKWQRGRQTGEDWNSCLRIGPGTQGGYSLYITERLDFRPGDQGLPARAILDATADEEILARLTGEQIRLERAEIDPPPGTRHVAIRTGKRYGKLSLTTRRKDGSINRDLQRAIAEARYVLREEDPEGEARAAHTIGLISFAGCVDAIGEALGIPEERRLHFWAARGSNALQDCSILLVIGTPTIHPATVARLARALWQDDPEPISEESIIDGQGIRRYVDPRMQRVNDYLTRSELTQCAHRSRALRQARVVVTFCLGEIDYLPATETITELPQLTSDGRERWTESRERERAKLAQARQALEERGHTPHMLTVRELKAAAEVSTDAAAEYLREIRRAIQSQAQQSDTHTHTHSVFVPEDASMINLVNPGTTTTVEQAAAPPIDHETAILAYGRAHDYPALDVGAIHIAAGSQNWHRFIWLAGPTKADREAVYCYLYPSPEQEARAG